MQRQNTNSLVPLLEKVYVRLTFSYFLKMFKYLHSLKWCDFFKEKSQNGIVSYIPFLTIKPLFPWGVSQIFPAECLKFDHIQQSGVQSQSLLKSPQQ